jgi:transcription termination/antitermination protein NusG
MLGNCARSAVAVAAELERAGRVTANQALVTEFKPGQALRLLSGPFKHHLVRFSRIVQRAHDAHPKLICVGEIFAQSVTLEIDPLNAKTDL